jgi:hypothetical protein
MLAYSILMVHIKVKSPYLAIESHTIPPIIMIADSKSDSIGTPAEVFSVATLAIF